MNQNFYNTEEAARVLGVNVQTMRKYLRTGKVRGLRLGRDWRVSDLALHELAASGPSDYPRRPIRKPAGVQSVQITESAAQMERFLSAAKVLQGRLRQNGYSGASGAEIVSAARDERTARIVGDDRE